jgi:hypothetical protein
MKCPHCQTKYHDKQKNLFLGRDADGDWGLVQRLCPECHRFILHLAEANLHQGEVLSIRQEVRMLHPKGAQRPMPSSEVPKDYRNDFIEASIVIADSPKASSALSRRCLQAVLRNQVKVKPGNLYDEIQEVLNSGSLPSHISESLDAVRHIGNFAAHPLKSTSTGEIIDVEEGEAEWNLEVLEALFDFYFVQPAILKKKKDALNQKLIDAGKKPMK